MLEQKLNVLKLINVACAKKEKKICFQFSVKYRRVDRTVWNHNTMPLPVTLDPLECKNIIRHLNGTNNKILNNLHYNKTFTLLEDHYFQERLEQFQTPFTVYQINKMYTGTFTFMPVDALHQFEVNLVIWRIEISEIGLTYDVAENVMIIDGHTLPCFFADGFCTPTTKSPFTLVWFSDDFCLIFTLQDFRGRMTKSEDRFWIETNSFVHSLHSTKPDATSGIRASEVQHILMYMLHIHKSQITLVFHFLKYFEMLKLSVVNLNLSILHNSLTFL